MTTIATNSNGNDISCFPTNHHLLNNSLHLLTEMAMSTDRGTWQHMWLLLDKCYMAYGDACMYMTELHDATDHAIQRNLQTKCFLQFMLRGLLVVVVGPCLRSITQRCCSGCCCCCWCCCAGPGGRCQSGECKTNHPLSTSCAAHTNTCKVLLYDPVNGTCTNEVKK